MNLLPVRVVLLTADLAPGALADLLRGLVGDGPAAPFTGAVAPDGFVIARMNEYRSTIMPLLRGTIRVKADGGTGVDLRLRPPGTIIVFMGIWLAFLAAVAAVIGLAHARDTGRSLLWLLVPAGLGAFSWFLMTAVFTADARWAVQHLVESVPALHATDPGEFRN
jgi:hypothetical protein